MKGHTSGSITANHSFAQPPIDSARDHLRASVFCSSTYSFPPFFVRSASIQTCLQVFLRAT